MPGHGRPWLAIPGNGLPWLAMVGHGGRYPAMPSVATGVGIMTMKHQKLASDNVAVAPRRLHRRGAGGCGNGTNGNTEVGPKRRGLGLDVHEDFPKAKIQGR